MKNSTVSPVERTTEVHNESSGRAGDGATSASPAANQNSRSARSSGLQEEVCDRAVAEEGYDRAVAEEVYDRAVAAGHADENSIEVSSKPPSGSTSGEGDLSWSPPSGIDEQGRKKTKKASFNLMEEGSEEVVGKVNLNGGRDTSFSQSQGCRGGDATDRGRLKEGGASFVEESAKEPGFQEVAAAFDSMTKHNEVVARKLIRGEGAAAREGVEDSILESERGERKLEYAKRNAYKGAVERREGGFGEVRFGEY